MKITFELNGEKISINENPAKKLTFFLRENRYTSVKVGCNNGQCSSCTVLMNNIPAPSCKISLAQADGKKITTLEEFEKTTDYQDIEKGFAQTNAVLCGFCNSGKIFTSHHIIETNPRPTREEIRDKISHFTCPCTEIDSIINGIFYAAAIRRARKNENSENIKKRNKKDGKRG
ncbi:MAG: (2Fe-2S)-binding protein [Treponemataceae bacterium]